MNKYLNYIFYGDKYIGILTNYDNKMIFYNTKFNIKCDCI